MKKTLFKTVSAATLIAGLALSGQAAFAHNGEMHPDMASSTKTSSEKKGVTVQVMKHLCNENIRNMSDFQALEAGRDPVAALANTVLNCPTTALPGDGAVANTVSSPRMDYDFKVTGEHYDGMWLSEDGKFMQHKLSEADINKDVDGNGTISADTALDISHYEFKNMKADNGRVEVTETDPPAGFKFGTVRFTPTEVDGNNDAQSLLATDEVQGRMQLDLTNDTDQMVMLHVYNFRTDDESDESEDMSHGSSTMDMNHSNSGIEKEISAVKQQIRDLEHRLKELHKQLM